MRAENKRRRGRVPAFAAIILGIMAAFTGITAARYVMQRTGQSLVAAQDFYFTSDYLKEESANASYYIDPAKTEFPVELRNFEDSKRITPGAIQYEVTVSGGTIAGSDTGILAANDTGTSVNTIKITPKKDAKTVTVTARSTSPYQKTLKAVFTRTAGNQLQLEDERGSRAAVLTMICTDTAKNISITLPEGVIPNEADEHVKGYDAGTNLCTFASPGEGVYSLTLLKTDSSILLKADAEGTFADVIVISQNQ